MHYAMVKAPGFHWCWPQKNFFLLKYNSGEDYCTDAICYSYFAGNFECCKFQYYTIKIVPIKKSLWQGPIAITCL
jgi:hypothetical protein